MVDYLCIDAHDYEQNRAVDKAISKNSGIMGNLLHRNKKAVGVVK
jgi:hypothetical protein